MGNTLVVPEGDARLNKLIDLYKLSNEELAQFWKIFQKLGKLDSKLSSQLNSSSTLKLSSVIPYIR
jgi:hypothetical protein